MGQRVLAFLRPRSGVAHKMAPRQRLWDYQGVDLQVGGSTTLSFKLDSFLLAQSNENGDRVVYPGDYQIAFSDGTSEATTSLLVTGDVSIVEKIFADTSMFRRGVPTYDIMI